MNIEKSVKQLKVLICSCTYPSPDSKYEGTFVANWAEQLQANGIDIKVYKRDHLTFGSYLKSYKRVVNFYTQPRVFEYNWQGVSICRQGIHLRFPLNYSKIAPKLTYKQMKPVIYKIYKEFPFDLIYLATWGDLSLSMSWIANEMGIPYTASAIGDHTNLYYDKPDSIYYKHHREIFLGSELVICVSDDLNKKAKILTDGKAKTITFYSGVDTEKFKSKPGLRYEYRNKLEYSNEDFVILFVGRLTQSKGIFDLLNAFARLSKKYPTIKLLMVGPLFDEKKVKKMIREEGLQRSVRLVGAVGHTDIPGYMNASDVFVLPSWMEGLPNVVMEACACERPVIASAVGGIPEIIENRNTGFLVPPKSSIDIAEKLELIIKAPFKASEIAKKGRQKMIETFNYQKNGSLLFNHLQKVISDYAIQKK
ncbi:glycosyltransferase [uncultured Desulfosarcina sp.]|uniref:glycosyltransferase n=1 Tax=uncultured Desulfosarcina sp. TaxID=218289 RepID=UPI0029C61EE7|nr:glycosyltransferase [uncultured Desulfosarcina sp.]